MKVKSKPGKKYEGLKFELLKSPTNVEITKTYNTVANPSVENDDRKR